MAMYKKSFTPDMAYPKIKHFCAYSERSHSEVREKLFGMGLSKSDVEILTSKLIEENYLNEERFAKLFAGGHFRQRKWGRNRIVYALRQKKISERNIQIGLTEIEETDYQNCLDHLLEMKWNSLLDTPKHQRIAKTQAYLFQKGYESQLVQTAIANFITKL